MDIIARLYDVVQKNMTAYQGDFDIDVEILKEAAQKPDAEDRCFFWMCRPHGTWCVKEREAFLEGTNAHSIWTYYDRDNERFKAFRIVVTGMENGRVMGELYPFDFTKQVQRIKAAALPVDIVTGEYANGKTFALPFSRFKSVEEGAKRYAAGGIKTIRYIPEDEMELQARIQRERQIETHGRREDKKPKHNVYAR